MTCVQLISLSALLFLHLTASTVSFLPFRVPPCSIYSNNTAWPAFLDIHVVIHRLSLYLFVYVHVLRVGLQLGTLHCMYIDYIWLCLVWLYVVYRVVLFLSFKVGFDVMLILLLTCAFAWLSLAVSRLG